MMLEKSRAYTIDKRNEKIIVCVVTIVVESIVVSTVELSDSTMTKFGW
jgi:hypothetical protein